MQSAAEELLSIAIVRQNVDFGVDTYVNVNNHYEGSAPLTIPRLLDLWRQSRAKAEGDA